MAKQIVKVLVASPFGLGGKGGMDRLMDAIIAQLRSQGDTTYSVKVLATRGEGSIAWSPLLMARFFLTMVLWRPNVLHINVAAFGSTHRKMLIADFARFLRIPYVIHLHGSGYMKFWPECTPKMQARIATMFERAASVIVLGQVWRNFVLQYAPRSPIAVVPNASHRPTLAPVAADAVRVLFLGLIGPRKGTFDLIEALAQVQDIPGWCATLAGDGEVEKARALLAKHEIAARVTVPGWVGPNDVAQLLANSDILVLPSYAENLPMSVIEGMAAGLAVIATPVGATEDIIIDGETGLMVAPGDVASLAVALRRLITDRDLRLRLGSAAEQLHRASLDMPPYVAKIAAIWDQAAA